MTKTTKGVVKFTRFNVNGTLGHPVGSLGGVTSLKRIETIQVECQNKISTIKFNIKRVKVNSFSCGCSWITFPFKCRMCGLEHHISFFNKKNEMLGPAAIGKKNGCGIHR